MTVEILVQKGCDIRCGGTTIREKERDEAMHGHPRCWPPLQTFVVGWSLEGARGLSMCTSVLVSFKASLVDVQRVKHIECKSS